MLRRLIVLIACLAAIGCDGSDGTDAGPPGGDAGPGDSGVDAGSREDDAGAGTDAAPGEDAGMLLSIPEPGMFRDRWTIDGLEIGPGHGTPGTAFQVGTVSTSPSYIGATRGRLSRNSGLTS